jgi:uncharacterized protein (TIGR04222 family)
MDVHPLVAALLVGSIVVVALFRRILTDRIRHCGVEHEAIADRLARALSQEKSRVDGDLVRWKSEVYQRKAAAAGRQDGFYRPNWGQSAAVPESPHRAALPAEPCQIAYLVGGRFALAQVVILALAQRGYLRVVRGWQFSELSWRTDKVQRAAHAPPVDGLSDVERWVLGWFDQPRTSRDVFLGDLKRGVEVYCAPYEAWARKEYFLADPERRLNSIAAVVVTVFIAAALFLSGTHLAIAAASGTPSGIWFYFAAVACVMVVQRAWPHRLSERGQTFVERLRREYKNFDRKDLELTGHINPRMLIRHSLFGRDMFRNSAYEPYARLFDAGTYHPPL